MVIKDDQVPKTNKEVDDNYFTLLGDIRLIEQNGHLSKAWRDPEFCLLDMETIDMVCRPVLENTKIAGEVCTDLFPNPPVKCDVDEEVRCILGDLSYFLRDMEENTRQFKILLLAQRAQALKENVAPIRHSTSLPIPTGKRRISHYSDRQPALSSVQAIPVKSEVKPQIFRTSSSHNLSTNRTTNDCSRRHQSFDGRINSSLPTHNNNSLKWERDSLSGSSWTSVESLPEAKRSRKESYNEGPNYRRLSTSDVQCENNYTGSYIETISPLRSRKSLHNQSLPAQTAPRRSSYGGLPWTPMASTPMAAILNGSFPTAFTPNASSPVALTPNASTPSLMGPPSSLPPSRRPVTRYYWER